MVVLTACGSSATPAGVFAPTPSVTSSATPEQITQKVALATQDFSDGTTVKLLDDGNVVTGQVTLDYCGYTFTTEAHRVARQQVVLTMPDGREFSNEVVAYDSAAEAAKALNEVRASASGCPLNVFEASSVADVPDLAYVLSRQASNPNLPVQDNAVVTAGVQAKGSSQIQYTVNIYLRRGSVLDAIYTPPGTAILASELTSVQKLAVRAGKNLVANGN